ncbi:MAG: rRNA maturation RNase YbeY [Acidobacteriota bacterium]
MAALDGLGYGVELLVDESVCAGVDFEQSLGAWLERVLPTFEEAGASAGTLTVRLTDDEEITRLNSSYRGKNSPTDVLSFEGQETVEGRHLGDIVISLPTARRQGQEEGHDLQTEVQLLALHGILHCLGYDHESDDGEMVALELRLREELLP